MTELNNNEDQIFQHHEMIQEVLQTEKYQENKNEEKLVTLKARPRSENKAKCLKNTSMKVKKINFSFYLIIYFCPTPAWSAANVDYFIMINWSGATG